jgi:arylformamidase
LFILIQIEGRTYQLEKDKFIDLSIPLNFNGEQPNAYGAEPAVSHPCVAGPLVGDTREGGSCNFEQYTFIPHCNGTHTESIGHITKERISLRDSLTDVFLFAVVVSVEPERGEDTADTYAPEKAPGDRLITQASLMEKLAGEGISRKALIVRTLPNDESKKTREYMKEPPPFFSLEAIRYISALGFDHLLVDMPSIDRMFDEGKLSAHRIFWKMAAGSFEAGEESYRRRTITEMIYVPNEVRDGEYLLNLQIAPFAADAAPSRPLIFALSDPEKGFAEFYEQALGDLELQARLRTIENREDLIAAVIEAGARGGFIFGKGEVEAAMLERQRSWLERWT